MLVRRRAFPSAHALVASDSYKTKTTIENFEKRSLEKKEAGGATTNKKRKLIESSSKPSTPSPPPPRSVRFDSPPQMAVERPSSSPKRKRRYQRCNSKVSHMFFTAESLGLDREERATIENDYNSHSNSRHSSSSAPAMSSSLLSVYCRYNLSPPPSISSSSSLSFSSPSPSSDTHPKPTMPTVTSREALLSSRSELLRRMTEAQRERSLQRRCLLDAARTALLHGGRTSPEHSPNKVPMKMTMMANASAVSFLPQAQVTGGEVNHVTNNNSLVDVSNKWPR